VVAPSTIVGGWFSAILRIYWCTNAWDYKTLDEVSIEGYSAAKLA
jgi:hypothetical protein